MPGVHECAGRKWEICKYSVKCKIGGDLKCTSMRCCGVSHAAATYEEGRCEGGCFASCHYQPSPTRPISFCVQMAEGEEGTWLDQEDELPPLQTESTLQEALTLHPSQASGRKGFSRDAVLVKPPRSKDTSTFKNI